MANEKTLEEARNIIASFLKNRRLELGYSQEYVALQAGFNLATVARFEEGHFWLGMKKYLLLCEALHLFPLVVGMETDTPLAEALRLNWAAKPKAMSVAEALEMKRKGKELPENNN